MRIVPVMAFILLTTTCVAAQPPAAPQLPEGGVSLGPAVRHRYRVGLEVTADGGPCAGLYATVSIPNIWPEQFVRVDNEDFSTSVQQVNYRKLQSNVQQMLVSIPRLPAGETARAVVVLEIEKNPLQPPATTSQFRIPKKLSREERKYLGISPKIEVRNSRIRAQARTLAKENNGSAWDQVEQTFNWVRDEHTVQDGRVQGAVAALEAGVGNHEDLTSLFIALCRAQKIPARTVWIPDGCYAEFCLADETGQTHWFPCRLTGKREFGWTSDTLPILQKGDNIEVPEKSEPQRLVAEYLKGAKLRGGGRPRVTFIRQILTDQ